MLHDAMQVMPHEWFALLIQAGGAALVCGMFLWFLQQKQVADDESRKTFLEHLTRKDEAAAEAADKQLGYLRERDAASQELARNGHKAVNDMAEAINRLRDEVRK